MSHDRTIAVISNPFSGRNRRGGFAFFETVIERYPEILHIVASDPADIIEALQKLSLDKIDILILNGGDGTFTSWC